MLPIAPRLCAPPAHLRTPSTYPAHRHKGQAPRSLAAVLASPARTVRHQRRDQEPQVHGPVDTAGSPPTATIQNVPVGRGVWGDTRRSHLHSHAYAHAQAPATPRGLHLTPHASRLAPCASRLAPQASRLAPRASRLAPRASRLAARASRLAHRASRSMPRVLRLVHRASCITHRASRISSPLGCSTQT